MSKRTKSKYKLDRRMGENIWGRPKSPVNRREYGPRANTASAAKANFPISASSFAPSRSSRAIMAMLPKNNSSAPILKHHA